MINRRRTALTTLLVAGALSGPASALGPTSTTTAQVPVLSTSVLAGPADDLLRRTNAERTAHGLAPLTADASLTRVAQAWSQHMASTGTMAHNPSYTSQIPAGWSSAAENVAWNSPANPTGIHSAWMGSAGHKANILGGRSTHVGIGWVVDSRGRGWATQVFAGYPGGTNPPRFWDVPASHPFHADIEWAATSRVANGYSDGAFRGESAVSREAMAAFVYRTVRGSSEPACTGSARAFRDVPASSPFCGVIEWMAREGIAGGYPDGTFRPAGTVSREATAAFLHRALGGTSSRCSTAPFADVRSDNQFCSSIKWMADKGISRGYSGGTFHPASSVSRQAMAAFLHRTR